MNRLKLKAKVRHLRRNPGEVDRQKIESERYELSALFLQLKQMQQEAGVAEPNSINSETSDSVDVWDDLAFDPVPIAAEIISPSADHVLASTVAANPGPQPASRARPPTRVGPVPIEDQILALPSNGNISNIHRDLETSHRVTIANEQLNNIRNLIAEKSFQFSHVIRVSPRKSVTTRSRAAVRKLNNEIAESCRRYTRCRDSLFVLGAENTILSRFKVLNPPDVSASTALLKPNEPGSTSIKLSWIWQSSSRHLQASNIDFDMDVDDSADDPSNVLECTSLFPHAGCFVQTFIVRRVHWLRGRAQLMRWREELSLTSYEMQWTVRFFLTQSKIWADRSTLLASQNSLNKGAYAYSKRKTLTWEKMAYKSDRSFSALNIAYKSPL